MPVNKLRGFIFENYNKRIGFLKEKIYYSMKRLKKKGLLLLATKLIEKIPDPRNAKEHYQTFMRRKNIKLVNQLKIITYKPNTFENPNVVGIKSVIIENPKTLHKLRIRL